MRLTLTDLFNGFGLAEVPQIAPDGTVRTKFLPSGYQVAEWAARRGVQTSDASILE